METFSSPEGERCDNCGDLVDACECQCSSCGDLLVECACEEGPEVSV